MVDMKNQPCCCTSVPASEAQACKLPLVDGETKGSVEILTTEIGLENARKFCDIYQRDRLLLYGMTCTAWALLLRCYTGQDQVTFEYKSDNLNAIAPLLQMDFDEDENLSKYMEKAKDAITGIEQKRSGTNLSSAAIATTQTRPHRVNTGVCICDSNLPAEMLAAKTAETIPKVSDEDFEPMI